MKLCERRTFTKSNRIENGYILIHLINIRIYKIVYANRVGGWMTRSSVLRVAAMLMSIVVDVRRIKMYFLKEPGHRNAVIAATRENPGLD